MDQKKGICEKWTAVEAQPLLIMFAQKSLACFIFEEEILRDERLDANEYMEE